MIFIVVLAGILGVTIGSFINVVVYRVPIVRSIVSPPSACPHCDAQIKAYDNIPVISWLILRGQCRNCKAPISARYPLVEIGSGLMFALVAWFFASPLLDASTVPEAVSEALVLAAFLYLVAVAIALALIDLDVHRLPNVIVLPAYAVSMILFSAASILSGDYASLARAGIGMVILATAYFAMAFAYPGGMGLGDVKLAGLIGIYLGWIGWGALVVGAFAAFLLGGIYAVALLLARRANRKSGIPFGPWMLVGAWLGIGAGNGAFAAYLTLVGLRAA